MRLVHQPLNEYYTIRQLTVSDLCVFSVCEYLYKNSTKKIGTDDTLLFGTYVHALLESYLWNKDTGYIMLDVLCNNENMCKKLQAVLTSIQEANINTRYQVIATEFKMYLEVEFGDVLYILEGTIDCLCKTEDGRYKIIDFKTSKSERSERRFMSEKQKIFYPVMLAQIVGEDNVVGFDYIVITKHKKPRIQIREHTPNIKEHTKTLIETLEKYKKAETTGVRTPVISDKCVWCPIKGVCPKK